ncbi:tetratricopeptide repeat protein [Sphingomonas aliaeris]|uniref:Tetratricopeptide repeat protein n=1 Tax=Sphingomonas aliaeris TaxID=2759526 RepID=A0A974NVG7_9SPHN|nr:tetratricopeptide repeat protein [Sphingomonas aliaeris]QQV77686.1 tetratricopeptide repeat protein [Sphingomonas aliaeris]
MGSNLRFSRYFLIGIAVFAAGSIGWRVFGDRQAGTPPVSTAVPDAQPAPDVGEMVAKLEAKLAAKPDDVAGWQMLGWSYFKMQRFADAARAYRRAADLAPATADNWSALGEALVLGNKGVGDDAVQAFRRALSVDPKDARARYFLAVRQDLEGDHRGAVDGWIALLKDAPPGAPWEGSVRQLVEQVATREKIDIAGRVPPPVTPPAGAGAGAGAGAATGAGASDAAMARAATDAIPGPTADQLASAAKLTPTQQDEMARGMVDRLAARLAANPQDADGWLRLMRARMVLNDRAGAVRALTTARTTFRGDAGTLAKLDAAARALSI